MTLEESKILLKDVCARLPYGIFVDEGKYNFHPDKPSIYNSNYHPLIDICKPYLRPMSSMTEEEKKEFQSCHCVYELHLDFQPMMCNLANELNMFDWLNEHHFDYRGLIEKGLAIEAPKEMYNL